MYTAALSAGVSGGIILSGLITITLSWRYIYFISSSLVGVLLLVVFFTFPETAFNRSPVHVPGAIEAPSALYEDGMDGKELEKGHSDVHIEGASNGAITHHVGRVTNHSNVEAPRKKSFIQRLAIFQGTFIAESVWRVFYRPILLLILPSILWATLCMSVTIGFLVAISSNFASAFATVYGFTSWQSGLCFISGFVGTFFGIYFGGSLSDMVADFFTRRNGGIREPEMRLPAVTIGAICSPLGLILYGVGIQNHSHWIMPTLGLGFLSFSIAQATNVTLVYVIDSYRPIAGETVVTQLAFKCKPSILTLNFPDDRLTNHSLFWILAVILYQ